MKNDKTPGPDGFTCEFFKFFWTDISSFIARAINNSKELMQFSEPNKLAIITCIPKYGKLKQFLKNWRPISLLNVIYKIASGCIAERIKKFLDKLIISPYLFLLCAEILGIFIRNNKDIKGITIAGEEYKISQYADDTSLVTNGSPESLNGILIELDMFASISGLRINFTKTKITEFRTY